jgi:hypothetical protein
MIVSSSLQIYLRLSRWFYDGVGHIEINRSEIDVEDLYRKVDQSQMGFLKQK